MPAQSGSLQQAEPALDRQREGDELASEVHCGGRSVTVIAVLVVFYILYFAAFCLFRSRPACSSACCLRPPRNSSRGCICRARLRRRWSCGDGGFDWSGDGGIGGACPKLDREGTAEPQKVEQRLFRIRKPLEKIKKATNQLKEAAEAAGAAGPQEVRVVQPALTDLVLSGTPQAVATLISVTILVYFLLASGDVFLRKLVTVIPNFHDKKRAVEITRQIEADISFYLLNFTFVSVGLGVAMAAVTALLGIPNPLLWGALVAVLNFVPYVGALTSVAILTIVGVQTFDSLPYALAAPAILLILVVICAEVITPFILGRGLLLNPVAIFIAILLWGWLWGLVGVLLAVPLLASFKIVCERVEPLHPIAEFLTT